MNIATKYIVVGAMAASLAACGGKGEDQAGSAVAPDAGVTGQSADAETIVPAAAGVQPLDVLKFSAATPTKAPCQLDLISGKATNQGAVTLPLGTDVLFQGWISTPDLKSPGAIALVLDGPEVYAIRGSAGGDRPDVARILRAEGLSKSGYNISAKLEGLLPGEYSLSLVQDWRGGAVQCATKATLIVTDS